MSDRQTKTHTSRGFNEGAWLDECACICATLKDERKTLAAAIEATLALLRRYEEYLLPPGWEAEARAGSPESALWESWELEQEPFNVLLVEMMRFAAQDQSEGQRVELAQRLTQYVRRQGAANGSNDGLIARSVSGSVRLFSPSESPVVNGRAVSALTAVEYDVVQTLLENPAGLTKDQLLIKSGRGSARDCVYRLANKDHWRDVIPLPGKAGRGYRIV